MDEMIDVDADIKTSVDADGGSDTHAAVHEHDN